MLALSKSLENKAWSWIIPKTWAAKSLHALATALCAGGALAVGGVFWTLDGQDAGKRALLTCLRAEGGLLVALKTLLPGGAIITSEAIAIADHAKSSASVRGFFTTAAGDICRLATASFGTGSIVGCAAAVVNNTITLPVILATTAYAAVGACSIAVVATVGGVAYVLTKQPQQPSAPEIPQEPIQAIDKNAGIVQSKSIAIDGNIVSPELSSPITGIASTRY
jgi:hypothetical protein